MGIVGMPMQGSKNRQWIGLLWLMLVGCRSFADYKAAELPEALRVTESSQTDQFDLSAMARRTLSSDVIYPGDVLEVTMATGMEEREPQAWPLRVSPEGAIEVPLIGDVHVAGRSLTDAEVAIRDASIERDVFKHPHIAVLMKQRQMMHVRVVGAVEKPGVHELPVGEGDLLSALVAAGGLTEKAGPIVEVRHPNSTEMLSDQRGQQQVMLASFVETPDRPPRIVRLDLTQLAPSESLDTPLDVHVEDGSVIVVHERAKKTVSVIGLVQRPNSYEIPAGQPLRVLDALALAGGPRVSCADRVWVIRAQPQEQSKPVTIRVSIRRAKSDGLENLVLAPGDVVEVQETPSTVAVETIRGFLRFGFTSAIPGL